MRFIGQKIKRFGKLSPKEFKDYLLTVLVLTFIFAFNDGNEVFSWTYWFAHALLTFALCAISIYSHIMLTKMMSLSRGLMHEYRMWTPGLIAGVVLALISNGNLYLLLFGGPFFTHSPIHRLGKFRYGLKLKDQGVSSMMGAVAHFVLATLGLFLGAQLGFMPEVFGYLATMNFWLMVYSLVPVPRLPGFFIFFYSRLTFVFLSATLIAYLVLALLTIYSWVLALIIGGVCWLAYYISFEKEL